jgi:oligopeptide transport system substrate-binding protein
MKKLFALIILITLLIPGVLMASAQKEVIKLGLDPGEEVISLNPYTASDSNSIVIMQNLYDGLFSYSGSTSEAECALTDSYEVSDDGLIWTFHLKNAAFSDGQAITSQTFVESWNYLLGGPLASNLSFVAKKEDGTLKLETPDDHTLVVYLLHAVSYLPSLLCQPCLAAIKDTTSYSGAYTLISQSDSAIILEKNKHYWGEVKNDRIEILLGLDFDSAFQNGEIQWSLAAVQTASDYMVISRLYATTFFYFSAKDGAYSNQYVRQALISLIPWDIIRYLQGSLMESDSLVPQSKVTATLSDETVELLEKGGYPYGEGLPTINMGITRGSQNATAAELIAEIWSKTLGVTVTLNTVPVSVYASNPEENPFDFCTMTWIGDYFDPMAFLSLFESSSSYNLANYSNAEFDKVLELAQNADEITRTNLLQQAEKLLLDDGVVIPVSTAFATNFVRDDLIEGWQSNPLDIHPFKDLKLIKTSN